MSIVNAFRSEWILLNRRRLWLVLGAITTAYTVVATALSISTAEPRLQQSEDGLALEALVGAGGATMAVIFSIAFAFLLAFVMFAASTGNEFTRGTLRTALTFQSNRLSLIAGKLAARVLVATVVMAAALVIGSITAAIVAPAQDVSTDGWFGLSAFGEAVEDYLRAILFVGGFAVIGTTVAVVLRSTPIALGVGLLWFGPIENVIGEGQDWADRWFPGMVIRSIVRPETPDAVGTPAALATLGAYVAVCAAVIAIVMSRRDATG
jgi:ABC-type transport system involved in multi-copper enzyme maturation permease subunit